MTPPTIHFGLEGESAYAYLGDDSTVKCPAVSEPIGIRRGPSREEQEQQAMELAVSMLMGIYGITQARAVRDPAGAPSSHLALLRAK